MKRLLRGGDINSPRHYKEDSFSFRTTSPISERRDKPKRSIYNCEGVTSMPNLVEAWKDVESFSRDKESQENESKPTNTQVNRKSRANNNLSMPYASSAPDEYSWSERDISTNLSRHSPCEEELTAIDDPSDDTIVPDSFHISSIWNTELPFPQSETSPLLATSVPDNTASAIRDISAPSPSSSVYRENDETFVLDTKDLSVPVGDTAVSRSSFEDIPRSRQLVLNTFLRWKGTRR